MASTKALLREFGKQSASFAFPQEEDNSVALPWSAEGFVEYIPPSDGWLHVRGEGTDISAEVVVGNLGSISTKSDHTWGSCFYPVKKGRKIYYAVLGSVSRVWILFVPAELAR